MGQAPVRLIHNGIFHAKPQNHNMPTHELPITRALTRAIEHHDVMNHDDEDGSTVSYTSHQCYTLHPHM